MPHACTEDQLVEQPDLGLIWDLLAVVKPALVAADREWREVAVKEAPDFRALSLLGPDENRLSDIISELLDPCASHGQGDTFLRLFSERCGSIGKCPRDRVTVHREAATISIENQNRRIDILIDGGTWGIGIENKPWAGEQKDQFKDYADDLGRRFGDNFLLIRLAGRDDEVTSMEAALIDQLSTNGKFASWQYAVEFREWVNECRRHCHAPRVATFLDEFSRYVEAEFVVVPNPRVIMERKHLLPALETILEKDPNKLRCLAAVAECFPSLRQKLVHQLFDDVERDVLVKLGSGWMPERSDEHFVETPWAFFQFAHTDWRNLYQVRLESQPTLDLVVLGIWHDKDRVLLRDEFVQRDLKRLGWGNKGGGPWWEGQSPLPEPFTNWTTCNGIAAVFMQREQLRTLLVQGFTDLCNHFKDQLAKAARSKR